MHDSYNQYVADNHQLYVQRIVVLQAIKARGEAEQKRKEKKAAMARPSRANSNPNMGSAARLAKQGGDLQQAAGQLLPVSSLSPPITVTCCLATS